MKALTNARGISVHNNGDLVSSSSYATRKIAPENSKKGEPNVVGKLKLPNISAPRCVLRDKTNNLYSNVKSTVYTPIGYIKLDNRLCSVTNHLKSRKNLSNSISFNQKQPGDTMKKSETSQTEENADVYEFVLDEGEVNENKPKGKTKKSGNKRKRVQRKIIDSPEEVLPTKKNRKPLQDQVSKNLILESTPRNRLGNGNSNLSSAKSFSDDIHPVKPKRKLVHFNNLSGDEIIKSSSKMQTKPSSPNCSAKNVSCPKNVQVLTTHSKTCGKLGTPNLSTLLHPSSRVKSVRLCTTNRNQVSSSSVSECDMLNQRMKENEASRQLLSFFSSVHTSSRNSYAIPVAEKTPAKQVAALSFQTDMGNAETGHPENVQPSLPSVPTSQHSDKTQNNLNVSNYFGFDDDAEGDDEDLSPAKTFSKSSHKLGKFQCSTPKDIGQKNGASCPFRFPALSIVKKRKFLPLAGNTPATVTNSSGKAAYESSDITSKRKPPIPANSPVTEPFKPAIFDMQDEDHEFLNDEKYEDEHQQLQVALKDGEAIPLPQNKVVQKSYGTPRHMTRLRRPVHNEVKDDSSEDEAEEILPKKHKKTHRPPKTKEADEWARCFNSMCETIDSFELIVE